MWFHQVDHERFSAAKVKLCVHIFLTCCVLPSLLLFQTFHKISSNSMIKFNNRNRGWGRLFYKLTDWQFLQCFYLSVVHFQFFTRHCPIGSREVFFLLDLLVKNFSVLLLNFLFAEIFVAVKHNLTHVVLYAFHLLLRPLQLFYDLLAFDSVMETLG